LFHIQKKKNIDIKGQENLQPNSQWHLIHDNQTMDTTNRETSTVVTNQLEYTITATEISNACAAAFTD